MGWQRTGGNIHTRPLRVFLVATREEALIMRDRPAIPLLIRDGPSQLFAKANDVD
jgi:hypothetical protein